MQASVIRCCRSPSRPRRITPIFCFERAIRMNLPMPGAILKRSFPWPGSFEKKHATLTQRRTRIEPP